MSAYSSDIEGYMADKVASGEFPTRSDFVAEAVRLYRGWNSGTSSLSRMCRRLSSNQNQRFPRRLIWNRFKRSYGRKSPKMDSHTNGSSSSYLPRP